MIHFRLTGIILICSRRFGGQSVVRFIAAGWRRWRLEAMKSCLATVPSVLGRVEFRPDKQPHIAVKRLFNPFSEKPRMRKEAAVVEGRPYEPILLPTLVVPIAHRVGIVRLRPKSQPF
jgi:hypothetical protein